MSSATLFIPFEQVKPATQTVIIHINAHFNLDTLFQELNVQTTELDPAVVVPGTLIGLSYNGQTRGISTPLVFKNSLVVRMFMAPDEVANFKLSRLGKLQMTGVKTQEAYVLPTLYLLKHIQTHPVLGIVSATNSSPVVQEVQSILPAVQRIPCLPQKLDYRGYQCWAVIVMFNTYITLPHHQNLKRLKEYILKHPEYGFVPTYEAGVTQALGIKSNSRFTNDELNEVEHPYFCISDHDLVQKTGVPQYQIVMDSATHLNAIELLGKASKTRGAVHTRNIKSQSLPSKEPKAHKSSKPRSKCVTSSESSTPPPPPVSTSVRTDVGTLLTYETNRTFMSAPGLEAERLYRDFCSMMVGYYSTSPENEKNGSDRVPVSKRKPKVVSVSTTPSSSSTSHQTTPIPPLSSVPPSPSVLDKMQAMRAKHQHSGTPVDSIR